MKKLFRVTQHVSGKINYALIDSDMPPRTLEYRERIVFQRDVPADWDLSICIKKYKNMELDV
jgi:hypothetical protein